MFTRTQLGHIYQLQSHDDGKTWSDPSPTTLVHPDAPPMIFKLEGDKNLIAFIHNRPASHIHRNSDFNDRRELWVSRSEDGGLSWSEPRFVIADATQKIEGGFNWVEVSYGHLIVDGGQLNFVFNHKKKFILNIRFNKNDIPGFPTLTELKSLSAG